MSAKDDDTRVSLRRSTRSSIPVVLAYRGLGLGNKWDVKLTSGQVDELCLWFRKLGRWRKNWFSLIYTPSDNVSKEEVYLLDCSSMGLEYEYVLYIAKGRCPSIPQQMSKPAALRRLDELLHTHRTLEGPESYQGFWRLMLGYQELFIRTDVQCRFLHYMDQNLPKLLYEYFTDFLVMMHLTVHAVRHISNFEEMEEDVFEYTKAFEAFSITSGLARIPLGAYNVSKAAVFCHCEECLTLYVRVYQTYRIKGLLQRYGDERGWSWNSTL